MHTRKTVETIASIASCLLGDLKGEVFNSECYCKKGPAQESNISAYKILGSWNSSSLSAEKPWFFRIIAEKAFHNLLRCCTLTGLKCSKLQLQHAMELRTSVQQSVYYKGTQHSKKPSQNIEVCLVLVTFLPFRWMVLEWVPKMR